MPLPSENVEWPPPDLRGTLEVIHEWDIWYGGDTDALEENYENHGDVSKQGSRSWKFWARRTPSTSANARRERMHIPVAGDIAMTSADLLFAAPLDIAVPGIREDSPEAQTAQGHLDGILERGGFLNRLLEAAEEAAALGGIYLRPTWDKDVAPYPILTHVTPDRAVPTFRYGLLSEVSFWRQISDEDEKKVLRHIEHHSVDKLSGRAVVENALYEGTDEKIGIQIDLNGDPRTAGLPERLVLPVDGLAVRYVKNMGPARRLRGTPHGRSDLDGIESLLDAIDEAWNSWMRDLRLSKARIIVPEEFLERSAVGSGSHFDTDQEIFTPLTMDPTEREKAGIEKIQPDIRFEAHRATLDSLVMEAVGKAGYSAQTFGFHGERDQTATEVVARQDKTHRTTDKKRRYWEPAVEDILEIMLTIDREMFDRKTQVVRPDVTWPDLEEPSIRQMAETVELLNRAEAASTETMVRLQHPEWSEVQVADEVAKISSSRQVMPNPFDAGTDNVPEDDQPPADE